MKIIVEIPDSEAPLARDKLLRQQLPAFQQERISYQRAAVEGLMATPINTSLWIDFYPRPFAQGDQTLYCSRRIADLRHSGNATSTNSGRWSLLPFQSW